MRSAEGSGLRIERRVGVAIAHRGGTTDRRSAAAPIAQFAADHAICNPGERAVAVLVIQEAPLRTAVLRIRDIEIDESIVVVVSPGARLSVGGIRDDAAGRDSDEGRVHFQVGDPACHRTRIVAEHGIVFARVDELDVRHV